MGEGGGGGGWAGGGVRGVSDLVCMRMEMGKGGAGEQKAQERERVKQGNWGEGGGRDSHSRTFDLSTNDSAHSSLFIPGLIFIPVHRPSFQPALDDPVHDSLRDEAHGVQEAVARAHVLRSNDAGGRDQDEGLHHGGEIAREGGRDAATERIAHEAEATVRTAAGPGERGGGQGDEDLGGVQAVVVLEVGDAVAVAAAPKVLERFC